MNPIHNKHEWFALLVKNNGFEYFLREVKGNEGILGDIIVENGLTLLHLAAVRGDIAIVSFLLDQHTIDPSARDDSGRDAIDLAMALGNYRVVELISRRLYPKAFE